MSENMAPKGPWFSGSFLSRSPSKECFQSYCSHLKSKENLTLLFQQLQYLLDWNDRNLEGLSPNCGIALDQRAIRMIFKMGDLLKVPDLTKMHAIEIYDRWALAFNSELKSMKPYFSKSELLLLEKKFEDGIMLHVGTCIQLASKSVCCGTNLFSEDLHNLLKQMNQPYSLQNINSSELKVLSALKFNLNCLTPLEVADVLLMLLNLEEDQYRLLYAICIRIIDYIYLIKNKLYAAAKDKINSQSAIPMTHDKMVAFENDYVLRAAAAIQCGTFISLPENPWKYLHSLEKFTEKSEANIRNLSAIIAGFLSKKA